MKAGSSGDEWLFHTTHSITLDQPLFFRINGFISLSKCHSYPALFLERNFASQPPLHISHQRAWRNQHQQEVEPQPTMNVEIRLRIVTSKRYPNHANEPH